MLPSEDKDTNDYIKIRRKKSDQLMWSTIVKQIVLSIKKSINLNIKNDVTKKNNHKSRKKTSINHKTGKTDVEYENLRGRIRELPQGRNVEEINYLGPKVEDRI